MDEDIQVKKEKLSKSGYHYADSAMDDSEVEEIELSPVETIVWDCTEAYLEKNLPRLLKDIMNNKETKPAPKRKKSVDYK